MIRIHSYKTVKTVCAAATALLMLSACEHKDLCYLHDEHAMKYHIRINADYRQEWEELCTDYTDWEANWPAGYTPYDDLRPAIPSGLRVVNYTEDGSSHISNLPALGGVAYLAEGENDLLFYNNDTEYIVFTDMGHFATTRATTRVRTRSTYMGNPYSTSSQEETTVNPPDMLYGNFIEAYRPRKVEKPDEIDVTMHPLVFTYKIRYEFAEGLEYVSLARGALSGMAGSVQMSTGQTSDEAVTLLYDCTMESFGARAFVKSFGIPGYPNPNYNTRTPREYGLNLEVRLKSGNLKNFNFDVTDQVSAQPHGGVIVVSGLVITKEEGEAGNVGGGFDVTVDDWGEYEDIVLPL